MTMVSLEFEIQQQARWHVLVSKRTGWTMPFNKDEKKEVCEQIKTKMDFVFISP